jgi:adenylate cyclase
MFKRILTSPWTALITLALIVSLRIADPTFVESVRLRYFDTLTTSQPVENIGINVVNIDEKALEKYGQFPFSRDRYAAIISDLYKRNAGLVVFNILTPDGDRMGKDNDYVQALQKYPVILPNIGSTTNRNTARVPGSVIIGPFDLGNFVTYPGIIANRPEIENAAVGVGIVNTLPEIDGVTRRMPLVIAHNGKLYPSLAMEVLRVSANDSTFQVKVNENGVEKMRIPQYGPVVTDSLSRIWIDWRYKPTHYSLTELPRDFAQGIVIVGVSAQGLSNPVATPLGEMLPQDLQAAVIATAFANKDNPVITRADWAEGAEVLALVVFAVVLLFLTRWVYVGLISGVVIGVGSIVIPNILYNSYWYLFDATIICGGIVLVAVHAYGVKFVSEFLQKQQIKKQFGSYVSPVIVERLQKDPSLIRLGGEEKMLTAVMTDMRNFTGLGEKYGTDVEGFTDIMNQYMTAIAQPVFKNDGCLIKFIGDASLHIHGAPLDDERHAYRGVKTALEMIEAVNKFNEHLASIDKPPVGMGAGVNTGKILVGNIGSEGKIGYDVLGDPVSVASRLEGQTKPYGVLVIIGPETYQEVKNDFVCLELDCIAVKGKAIGLNIYTPLGETGKVNVAANDIQMHTAMIELYRQQKFDTAIKFCGDLKGRFNGVMDHYYDIWIQRCKEMKTVTLPKDWDGVYRATSK